ncbi:MAG: hypothetical protein HeimC2_06790 [Candidatus Heimdallarchaeota archaeon LC_2]|nr:MAG: hypothetical protein HeimC2_06790 [Candidatus Heimdallarchaeota archaeon LC_2]
MALSEEYTNLKRIPKDSYKVKLNPDDSMEIFISPELSKLLNISSVIEFRIRNEMINNKEVIVLKSTKRKKDNIMYN